MLRSCLAGLVVASAAHADVIYQTEDPFGGIFGLWGADIFIDQSAAIRFTADADYRLDRISLWFMNNSSQRHEIVSVWLVNDENDGVNSLPGSMVYHAGEFATSAIGWDPQLESVDTLDRPLVRAGKNYWIMCMSDAPGGENPVWNFASSGLGFASYTDGGQHNWQPGMSGAALTGFIEGTPVRCIADFNMDRTLNSLDFLVFLNAFSAGSPRADLNADGTINTLDFLEFLTVFNAGC